MKLFGTDIIKKDKGYFGIRRCAKCGELKEVNLLELEGVERFFYFFKKKYVTKRFLTCNTCNSIYEITDEQWAHYTPYLHNRLNKEQTKEVVETLDTINKSFVNNGTFIDITNEIYHPSIDSIYEQLIKKYGHKETLEELISVFFSNQLDEKNEVSN